MGWLQSVYDWINRQRGAEGPGYGGRVYTDEMTQEKARNIEPYFQEARQRAEMGLPPVGYRREWVPYEGYQKAINLAAYLAGGNPFRVGYWRYTTPVGEAYRGGVSVPWNASGLPGGPTGYGLGGGWSYQSELDSIAAQRRAANARLLAEMAKLFQAAQAAAGRSETEVPAYIEKQREAALKSYEEAIGRTNSEADRLRSMIAQAAQARGGMTQAAGAPLSVAQTPSAAPSNSGAGAASASASDVRKTAMVNLLKGAIESGDIPRPQPADIQTTAQQASSTPYLPVIHPVGEATQGIAQLQSLLGSQLGTYKGAIGARMAEDAAAQRAYADAFKRGLSSLSAREQARALAASEGAISNMLMQGALAQAQLQAQLQAQQMDPMAQMQQELARRQYQQILDVDAARARIRQRGDDAFRAFEELWNKYGPQVAVQAARAEGEPKWQDWIRIMGGNPDDFKNS